MSFNSFPFRLYRIDVIYFMLTYVDIFFLKVVSKNNYVSLLLFPFQYGSRVYII